MELLNSETQLKNHKNKTTVNFLNCFKKISLVNNIPLSSLYLITIDFFDNEAPTNILEYYVLTDKGEKINLSLCESEKISIHFPIDKNKKDEEFLKAFPHNKYNIFNLEEKFFKNKCIIYSYKGTDYPVISRINKIHQDSSEYCGKGCSDIKFNFDDFGVECICPVKTNFTTTPESKKVIKTLINSLLFGNFYVFLCPDAIEPDLTNLKEIYFFVGFCLFELVLMIQLYNCGILEKVAEAYIAYYERKYKIIKDDDQSQVPENENQNPLPENENQSQVSKSENKSKVRDNVNQDISNIDKNQITNNSNQIKVVDSNSQKQIIDKLNQNISEYSEGFRKYLEISDRSDISFNHSSKKEQKQNDISLFLDNSSINVAHSKAILEDKNKKDNKDNKLSRTQYGYIITYPFNKKI